MGQTALEKAVYKVDVVQSEKFLIVRTEFIKERGRGGVGVVRTPRKYCKHQKMVTCIVSCARKNDQNIGLLIFH